MRACGVVAVSVAVLIGPLRGQVRKHVDGVVPAVPIGVRTAVSVGRRGIALNVRACIGHGPPGVVEVSVSVRVHPLRAVVGSLVFGVGPTVTVRVGTTKGAVLPRGAGLCRAGIGQGTGAVVAVAVAVLVGPLGAVHDEGIRAIGDGPHAVWVRPAVTVSVGTPLTVHRRGTRSVGTGVIDGVVVAVAIAVRPARCVAWEGIGTVEDGPTAVGVRVTVTVCVWATVPIHRRAARHTWTGVTHRSSWIVPVSVGVSVHPLGGVGGPFVRPLRGGPSGVWVRIAVSVAVRAPKAVVG